MKTKLSVIITGCMLVQNMMGASNVCQTCAGKTTISEAIGEGSSITRNYEEPGKYVCGEPNTSEYECKTDSQYLQTIPVTIITLLPDDTIIVYDEDTYTPCYSDDTPCGETIG